ncbi:bifunctional aspartate kinase/homoserine dehydrogenase I, partial [bacterium]|nr:bifunctional aspartate kinase/homoserine dehydrogenase I [bacterium]
AGAAVVTANKLRLAGSMDDWRATVRHPGGRLYHETTVGAALPVVGTLRDLVSTGDRIRRIEGVLSGTLAFLFDELFRGATFSDIVRRAGKMGYTEPDPREDLGGRDVARKILILARLAGRPIEPDDVRVEGLLSDEWNAMPQKEFLERLAELDDEFAARIGAARGRGKRVVYLATLDDAGARVGPQEVDESHPAVGNGTDNIVAFTTDRYDTTPLVVRGPGAGPELTASGVFADILRAIAEGGGTGEGT